MSRVVIAGLVIVRLAATAAAATVLSQPSAPPRADRVSRIIEEAVLPVGSLLLPGFGQAAHGEWAEAAGFFGVSMVGVGLALRYDVADLDTDVLPRERDGQAAFFGAQLAGAAGMISAYHSFRHTAGRLQPAGEYAFFERSASTRELFLAPFDISFLRRPRTFLFLTIPLGLAVVGAIVDDDDDGSLRAHDALWSGGVSYNAGVGEEAFFRGYLYPLFYGLFGKRDYLANTTQALLFGAAHLGSVDVPIAQTLAGAYFGWVTKRNEWNIRESIFQHFWWDAIIITAAFAISDDDDLGFSLALPTVRF